MEKCRGANSAVGQSSKTMNVEDFTLAYTHLTLSEREHLQAYLEEGQSLREIARRLGRSPSTVCRELKRNRSKYRKANPKTGYHPWRATVLYKTRRKNCRRRPIIGQSPALDACVAECLGRYWSPEITAHVCRINGFSISATTVYRAIKQGKLPNIGERTHLRRRGLGKFKKNTRAPAVQPTRTIHERPDIANRKLRFGDWEGDTVYGGVAKGCIVTLTDRKSRLLLAALSPTRSSEDVRRAFKKAFSCNRLRVPVETITLDNGSEFALFRDIERDLKTEIYFADPHSPWQRGLNESTNGMLRFFFPKGTNFLKVSDAELQRVVNLINNRPRKCLGYLSPSDFFRKNRCD